MRVLFASAPLAGHLDWGGMLKTAVALSAHGHVVHWVSGAGVERTLAAAEIDFTRVDETGWRWPPPPPLPQTAGRSREEVTRLRQERSLDQWLDVERVTRATLSLLDVVHRVRPDVIVAEMFMAGAALAAEATRTPLAVAGWPAPAEPRADDAAASHPLTARSRARLQTLLNRFDLGGTNWTAAGPAAICSPQIHISYFSPTWYGRDARHGAQTRYVGGVAAGTPPAPAADLPDPDQAPWVLITLGTSFNRDPDFFAAAAQAALQLGARPILAVGPGADLTEIFTRIPRPAHPDLVIRERVLFDNVLPYTGAAIHHGGAGTTHAMILQAVPQLVVPHAGDQRRQAQGVARTGIGFHIAPHQATVANLTAGLAEILPDRSVQRTQARRLAAEFQALGGPPVAARTVEALADR